MTHVSRPAMRRGVLVCFLAVTTATASLLTFASTAFVAHEVVTLLPDAVQADARWFIYASSALTASYTLVLVAAKQYELITQPSDESHWHCNALSIASLMFLLVELMIHLNGCVYLLADHLHLSERQWLWPIASIMGLLNLFGMPLVNVKATQEVARSSEALNAAGIHPWVALQIGLAFVGSALQKSLQLFTFAQQLGLRDAREIPLKVAITATYLLASLWVKGQGKYRCLLARIAQGRWRSYCDLFRHVNRRRYQCVFFLLGLLNAAEALFSLIGYVGAAKIMLAPTPMPEWMHCSIAGLLGAAALQ